MKYLVLFAVLFLVYLLWRHERRNERTGASSAPPPAAAPRAVAAPQEMVRCAVCSVHLPRAEALPAPGGNRFYCCAEHLRKDAT
ncbi:hypothetical protein JI739_20830 [Ramlibacter sp. AW1]|uniref:Preprotein translocase subunit YajC n=1 Tax=Ramlibacter aurantiacus TaxID=2801330 RepID=A0A936ZSR5_9BURK|nr:PP0621 family protein [Ramlibacter aurantiacus]MBL0422793.1 hypothetical protein [Ramlibacter aurantiacus]